MTEYFVLAVEECEECEGKGVLHDLRYDEANGRAMSARAEYEKLHPPPDKAIDFEASFRWDFQAREQEGEAWDAYWAEQGYPVGWRLPPEEYPCCECEGEGVVNRRVTLAEALLALKGAD